MTIPKTKEECFALLDKELSDEDKRYLIEDEDAAMDVHFSLGMCGYATTGFIRWGKRSEII